MKQLLQSLKTGSTELTEVPCPRANSGQLLIRTTRSLVSAGTERMLIDFGKANLLDKARQQPDKVRMVLDKVKTDGLMPTLDAVRNKLDQPLPMGYCNSGVVLAIGDGVSGLSVGDRVASNGKHAEVVSVPKHLCAKVPETVTDEAAAFTVISAIALQGIRLVQPTLGESIVVTGLGLIGLIAVQLLRAHGCRVLGIDMDPTKLEMARQFGAETVDLSSGEDPVAAATRFSRGRGMDAVIITAATKSNEPMHQAALMCRKRGRIVLVGVVGLELSRADFYEKHDLHLHFPEGAVPKDGPSAGAAITTAIVSTLTGIPVRANVGMTGEITLRGEVLPIGGLKEKLLAAQRGGLTTVLIPQQNVKDLADIPDNVKNALEIVPVKWIDEVLAVALERAPVPLVEDIPDSIASNKESTAAIETVITH